MSDYFNITPEFPPELEIDKILNPKFRGMAERFVVWNLFTYLAEHGWKIHSVHDSDKETLINTPDPRKQAMELVFNLDIAWVTVRKVKTASMHTIMLVFGNSPEEVVADYGFTEGDLDGFNALMEGFSAERLLWRSYLPQMGLLNT